MFDRGLLGFPEGGITLKSKRQSPYYYNGRPGLSFSKKLDRSERMPIRQQIEFRKDLIAGYAAKFLQLETEIDHVLGRAQAGTPPASTAAIEAGLSCLWERVDEPSKTYGAHQRIEGDYEEGETVLLADDVVTDGQSKIEGAKVLAGVGLELVAVTLQFDREEGGVQLLEASNFEVNAVTGLSNAVGFLLENKRIGNKQIEALDLYHDKLKTEGLTSTYDPYVSI